jgi:hypothetical protein
MQLKLDSNASEALNMQLYRQICAKLIALSFEQRRDLVLGLMHEKLKAAIEEALASGASRTAVRQTVERILRPK